jgi:Flp pilus assembly protein TadD
MKGQVSDSISLYERASRIAPENAEVRAALGLALRKTGQYAEAREELTHALRLLPQQPAHRDQRQQLQDALQALASKS